MPSGHPRASLSQRRRALEKNRTAVGTGRRGLLSLYYGAGGVTSSPAQRLEVVRALPDTGGPHREFVAFVLLLLLAEPGAWWCPADGMPPRRPDPARRPPTERRRGQLPRRRSPGDGHRLTKAEEVPVGEPDDGEPGPGDLDDPGLGASVGDGSAAELGE